MGLARKAEQESRYKYLVTHMADTIKDINIEGRNIHQLLLLHVFQ